jgi:hypothetical protein
MTTLRLPDLRRTSQDLSRRAALWVSRQMWRCLNRTHRMPVCGESRTTPCLNAFRSILTPRLAIQCPLRGCRLHCGAVHLPQRLAHRLLCESITLSNCRAVAVQAHDRTDICLRRPSALSHRDSACNHRTHAVVLQGWLLDGSAGGSNISLYGDAVGVHRRASHRMRSHVATSFICCAPDRAAISVACWHAR